MPDIAHTTEPNSDQLTVEHFIAGPKTITVTKAEVKPKGKKTDQPVSIFFYGDEGKPYKPGLSMRRIIYSVWGGESSDYVGRSMTLYVDPTVAYKGQIVGGVRISHMSNITERKSIMLTIRQGQKAPWTIEPLVIDEPKDSDTEPPPDALSDEDLNVLFLRAKSTAAGGMDEYKSWFMALNAIQKAALQNTKEPDRDGFDQVKSVHDACKGIAGRADINP